MKITQNKVLINELKPINSNQQRLLFSGILKDTFISKTNPQEQIFIQEFLNGKNKDIEQVLLTHDFTQYGKNGIPLKYPRENFVQDINKSLEGLNKSEQEQLLSKFNLRKGEHDIDGIAYIDNTKIKTPKEKELKRIIERFYYKNESTIEDPKLKKTFDSIIKGFPEFNMTIGKKQHATHIYSVDIHSLIVLQKSMQNPLYKTLSNKGKQILKLAALMHDFGKKGFVSTRGHALISEADSSLILRKHNLPTEIKEKSLHHVKNHHWFQSYNQGYTNEKDVFNIFRTKEDFIIARLLTKSDFESVKPNFHLRFLIPDTLLTPEEFDVEFNKIMDGIQQWQNW